MAFTFFRKYNKIILAVGGSLLMVVFLIPQAGNWFAGAPTGQTIGRIGEKALTVGDRRRAQAEMRIVRLLFDDARWVRSTLPRGGDAPLQWLLGLEEARQMGLWVSRGEVDRLFNQAGVSSDTVSRIKTNMNVSDAFVEQAARHLMLWRRLRRLTMSPARVSEPRLRHFFQQLNATASVDAVRIPAAHLLESVEPPTEAELRERFRINRDDPPGQGQYGLGYRLPPRVKLEYIAVPLEPIRASVTVDEVEARVYYNDHKERFIPEPASDDEAEGAEDGETDGGGAEAPGGEAEAPSEPRPYEAVRERIIETLKEQKAQRRQRRAVDLIVAALNEAMRGIERDPTSGYYDLPAEWQPPDLGEVAGRVQEADGVEVLPRVERIEDRWLTMEEVGRLPGLGEARVRITQGGRQRPVPVAEYVRATRELGQREAQERVRPLALQEEVASRPVSGPDGTTYIFRVSEGRPPEPPASLEVVRDRVVADVKRLKAYRLLNDRAEAYVGRAAEEGLSGLVERLGEGFEVRSLGPFSQRRVSQQMLQLFGRVVVMPPRLPGIGQSEAFVDRVFALARPLAEAEDVAAVPPAERMGSIPLDDRLALYIVAVTDYTPAYAEDYAANRRRLAQILRLMDVRESSTPASDPFSLEALAGRVGYVAEEREAEQPEEELPEPERGERPADAPEAGQGEAAPTEEATP